MTARASVRRMATRLAKSVAILPKRAVDRVDVPEQQRLRLLLGEPPLGSAGSWSVIDPSLVEPLEDEELVALALDGVRAAFATRLDPLIDRAAHMSSPYADWLGRLPGEHYRLLAGLVEALQPRTIVEVGTYTGASALVFHHVTSTARIVTYDIVPWPEIPGVLLEPEDFEDGRLEQRIADIADPAVWDRERDTFADADLIFVDGPKDGVFEPDVLPKIAALPRRTRAVLVIDDIRFMEMIRVWRSLPGPKLDLTSFGHWSGTGVVLLRPTS